MLTAYRNVVRPRICKVKRGRTIRAKGLRGCAHWRRHPDEDHPALELSLAFHPAHALFLPFHCGVLRTSAPLAAASPPAAASGVLTVASRLAHGFCSLFICCCPTALASIDSVPRLTPANKMFLASLYKPPLGSRGLRKRPYLLQPRLKIDRVFLELHIMHTLG